MAKYVILSALFIYPFIAHSQQSIGFSDPDNIQPLLDYRLPEWGYENLFLDFSLNGNYASQRNTNHNIDLQLNPTYYKFRQSETRTSIYSVQPSFHYSIPGGYLQNNDIQSDKDLVAEISWNLREDRYLENSDAFWIGRFSGNFSRQNQRFDDEQNTIDLTTVYRRFNPVLEIGFGYGRLRNVNPMIRSLRLNERINALNPDQSLNQGDLFNAAEQFTKLNGYNNRYDRPEKYFWGDMDQLLSYNLAGINAFDLLYLTDVTKESIGNRSEGWRIYGSLSLLYNNLYSKEENNISGELDTNSAKTTFLAPAINGGWGKNLSLKHHLSLSTNFSYHQDIQDDMPGRLNLTGTMGWLYTISDRILATTSVSYFHSNIFDDSSIRNNVINGSAVIDYFVENSLSFYASLQYISTHSNNSSNNSLFIYNAGVRYYFMRGLM